MAFYADKLKELDQIEADTIQLLNSIDKFEATEDIQAFNLTYKRLVAQLSKLSEDIKGAIQLKSCTASESKDLQDRCNGAIYDLDWVYNEAMMPINEFLVKKTDDLGKSLQNTQGLQLAVFSMVLTILAFVLTNAKILAVDAISFKNVLLVNISYLLCADVFFSFIYLFMGPIFHHNFKGIRATIFVCFPILLVIALVLVALLMP